MDKKKSERIGGPTQWNQNKIACSKVRLQHFISFQKHIKFKRQWTTYDVLQCGSACHPSTPLCNLCPRSTSGCLMVHLVFPSIASQPNCSPLSHSQPASSTLAECSEV